MKKVTITKEQIEAALGIKLIGVKIQGGLVGREQSEIGFYAYPDMFEFIVSDSRVESDFQFKGGRDGESL